jgi:peptidyl-prolyl cis-trans isomerase SurA
MRNFILCLILSVSCVGAVFAQEDNRTLFTLDGRTITVSEFEYVYNKNNLNNLSDYSRESLEEYLDLYINFRLKVREAEALGYDTIGAIQEELAGYRKQLANSYLTDREILDDLLEEAYDRNTQVVSVSHILVLFEGDDTMSAWKEVQSIEKQLDRGKTFESLAKQYSDDTATGKNGGFLGEFTVFQTFYDFENAMYETPIGEVSKPVSSKFGYHLLKVNDRKENPGRILVAHILKKYPKKGTAEDSASAEAAIKVIYDEILSGEISFEDAAMQYSDDKTSSVKSGQLPWFSVGQMVEQFANAAFALKEDGQISEPIESPYGWHIIKRISAQPIMSYADTKYQLKKKIEKDERARQARLALVERIKEEHGFSENADAYEDILAEITDNFMFGKWRAADKTIFDETLFTIGEKEVGQVDFVSYLETYHRSPVQGTMEDAVKRYYENYVAEQVLTFEEDKLEAKYPEFKALMQEYRAGILLFELTDKKVWSRAIEDASGLKAYHEEHKTDYLWDERLQVVVYHCKDAESAELARKLASKGKSSEVILKKANKGGEDKVTAIEGKYQKGQYDLIDNINWVPGLSQNVKNPDGSITFVDVIGVVPPEPKELHEAKGYIVSDYQDYLEKEWVQELRAKYPIEVNEEVFESLIKE